MNFRSTILVLFLVAARVHGETNEVRRIPPAGVAIADSAPAPRMELAVVEGAISDAPAGDPRRNRAFDRAKELGVTCGSSWSFFRPFGAWVFSAVLPTAFAAGYSLLPPCGRESESRSAAEDCSP